MRGIGWAVGGLLFGAGLLSVTVAEDRKSGEPELHFGAGSCAAQACHGGGDPARMEYKTWATKDPHSGAHESLHSERGKAIGRRLGIDAATAKECLVCHGTTGVELAETFDPSDGVSCELCHGGARNWLGPHVDEAWRRKSPEEKESKFGLVNLTTADRRAARCVACHVGDQKHPITHRIMAAGHPPLSFDGGKFMRDLHPHWKDDPDQTIRAWVEGLRHAAVAELERIAHAARDRRAWPELSVFDCDSCHHEIGSGTAYEESKQPGAYRLDLATLHVLREIAEVRVEVPVPETVLPHADPRELAKSAEAFAAKLRALPIGTIHLERARARLHAALTKAKETPIPPRRLLQLCYAVDVLAPNRDSEEYRKWRARIMRRPDADDALGALAAGGYPKR